MIASLFALSLFLSPDPVLPVVGSAPAVVTRTVTPATLSEQARQELIKKLLAMIEVLKQFIAQKQAELANQAISGATNYPTDYQLPPAPALPAKPFITNVSPSHGPIGTVVTVTGSGFTPTSNRVYTGYDDFYLPSPDGQTLTFTVNPPIPPELSQVKTDDFPVIIFRFYIKNANGLSELPGQFRLDI